jgi:hypothetical protein
MRLGWKRMAVANALDYYYAATIIPGKSFIVQGAYSQNFIFFVTYELVQ